MFFLAIKLYQTNEVFSLIFTKFLHFVDDMSALFYFCEKIPKLKFYKPLKKMMKCYRIIMKKSYSIKNDSKKPKTFLNRVLNMTNYSKD